MQVNGLDIAVIGGGIGGMAAAAALARRGARVTVHEQAPALQEVGAGLQISANGQAVLRGLGAVSGVPAAACVSAGTRMCDGATGRRVAVVPAPRAGPTWYLHRADLLDLLHRAALAAGVTVRLGQRQAPGAVSADLIVAADGGQSAWRAAIDGPDSPAFSGQVAWRALVPWQADVPDMAALYMGSGAHVVVYPLRGGSLLNLVAVQERRDWTQEGWALPGDPAEFRARFGGFRGLAGTAIARVTEVHKWALHLRPVARRWQDGTVALLGDAAHPTLPFFAQGACMALEDAWVLADALERAADVPGALALYESVRAERARRIVALASRNAWRFHLPRPWAWGAHLALGLAAGRLADRLEWVYSYDPVAKNVLPGVGAA